MQSVGKSNRKVQNGFPFPSQLELPHFASCKYRLCLSVSVSLFVDEEYTNQPEQDMHRIEKALASYKNS